MKLAAIISSRSAEVGSVCALVVFLLCLGPASSSCRTDWTEWNRFCYRLYSDTEAEWQSAEKYCQQQGGHLVSIHSDNEMNFLSSVLLKSYSGGKPIWIGLSDRDTEMTFKWSDDSKYDYSNWEKQPVENVNCNCTWTVKSLNYQWDVENCGIWGPYICKYASPAALQAKETRYQLYTSMPNKAFLSHTISSKNVSSIVHCSSLCLQEPNCKSFSYGQSVIGRTQNVCYINTANHLEFPAFLVEKTNFVYAVPVTKSGPT